MGFKWIHPPHMETGRSLGTSLALAASLQDSLLGSVVIRLGPVPALLPLGPDESG